MKTTTRYFTATRSRAEEPLNDFVTADCKMRRNISEDSGQRANFDRIMIWNRDIMLAAFVGAQPQVATCFGKSQRSRHR
jgi:hypothetical protein